MHIVDDSNPSAPQQLPKTPLNPKQVLEATRLQLLTHLEQLTPLATDPYFKDKTGFMSRLSDMTDKDGNRMEIQMTCEEAYKDIKEKLAENLEKLRLLDSSGLITLK